MGKPKQSRTVQLIEVKTNEGFMSYYLISELTVLLFYSYTNYPTDLVLNLLSYWSSSKRYRPTILVLN